MEVRFGCTLCGKCCTDLRLPLTIAEAMQWIERGHTVEVLCEAVPWPIEPAGDDAMAQHKRASTFGARSGTLPVRIGAILAATHDGPCPNLGDDKHCRIYASRPMVCQIYPAEVNPFVQFSHAAKACPPEAWDRLNPAFFRNGQWVSESLRATIERSRNTTRSDARHKAAICAALNISLAALANEGYVVHRPPGRQLHEALKRVSAGGAGSEAVPEWTVVSNRASTRDTLESVGATVCPSLPFSSADVEYLPFFADQ